MTDVDIQTLALFFIGVRVTLSLGLCVCFVDRFLSFFTFSFGHCVVYSSSICGFWLPPFGIFKLFLSFYQLVQTNRKVLLNIETLITHYYLATRFKRPCVGMFDGYRT
jgi:hypothetical protein